MSHSALAVAEAAALTTLTGDADPGAIAAAFGVAVYAVPWTTLRGARGRYMRIAGREAVVQVDDRLRGAVLATVVAHELAHHLVWWWRLEVEDEEEWCDAVARAWLARRPHAPAEAAHAADRQAA